MRHFFTSVIVATSVFLVPAATLAQTAPGGSGGFGSKYLNQVGQRSEVSGIARTDLMDIIPRIINVILSLLGLVLLGYLLYAGYLWMTAQGDSKQVDTAKAMIKNAIIGLLIVSIAFAITNFVLTRLWFITSGAVPLQ